MKKLFLIIALCSFAHAGELIGGEVAPGSEIVVDLPAPDFIAGLKFHTVGGYSMFGREFLAGELAEVVTFRKCLSFEVGSFWSQTMTYPSAGLGLDVKEAIKQIGGNYQWNVPLLEPKLGLAVIVNPNVFLYGYKDRLADVVIHANIFTVKLYD